MFMFSSLTEDPRYHFHKQVVFNCKTVGLEFMNLQDTDVHSTDYSRQFVPLSLIDKSVLGLHMAKIRGMYSHKGSLKKANYLLDHSTSNQKPRGENKYDHYSTIQTS